MTDKKNILVIKLGALGDFIQAMGPMAAIRKHHPDDHIVLLTTKPFVTLGRDSGYFDEIWTDNKPGWTDLYAWVALAKKLRAGRFERVYDLQNNDRTSLYFKLFGLLKENRPEWVGAARGASHRNASVERTSGHAFYGHVQTLGMAGINDVQVDDMGWVRGNAAHFGLPHPYVLLVPGSAPGRLEKRWPSGNYAALARHLQKTGYTPVVIGTSQEEPLALAIQKDCPESRNLCGQTSVLDLVLLARSAAGAIGNDTGPMHMIAPTGCPSVVLFSRHSDPKRHMPLGPRVKIIEAGELTDLAVENVIDFISKDGFRHKGQITQSDRGHG